MQFVHGAQLRDELLVTKWWSAISLLAFLNNFQIQVGYRQVLHIPEVLYLPSLPAP